ncbi:MAG: aldehyde dehydrogenase family protein, partial [Phycisphaerales bacterium]|nr:aldehyde dehydrogenase family protein [Phycisphaerales bacterium]
MTTLKTTPEVLVSINPATGEPVGEVPCTPVDRIPQLVRAAAQAQVGWAALSLAERAEILREAGKRLEEHAERIGTLLT